MVNRNMLGVAQQTTTTMAVSESWKVTRKLKGDLLIFMRVMTDFFTFVYTLQLLSM
jgi:hypothetical protein